MSNIIDKIRISGVTYDIQGGGGGVPESAFTAYTAATDARIAEDEEVTSAGLNELNEALSGKQDTLIAGDNITISGNVISAEGGGKAIEAGRGIDITTGETADTVSINLPISAGTGSNSIIEGYYLNKASGQYSHAEGYRTEAKYGAHSEGTNTKALGYYSHAEGSNTSATTDSSHAEGSYTVANGITSHAEGNGTVASGITSHAEGNYTIANGNSSHAEGHYTQTNNNSEHASGQYNVSNKANIIFGNSGNTLFSVGNGTASNARHNAFEIRQNGDIYLTLDGQDVKLQDHLGGGITPQEFSAYTAATDSRLSEDEEVTAAGLNALNDKFGGLSLVKLTQAAYDALTVKDNNVLYIIIN